MSWEAVQSGLAQVMAQSPWLGPLAALAGGALTALNPCVLATIPVIIGFVGGFAGGGMAGAHGAAGAVGRPRVTFRRGLVLSLLFVAGLSLELAVLFGVASGAAGLLRGEWWTYVTAAVCLLLGLHLLGVLRLPALFAPSPGTRYAGAAGAVLLGFLFGLISLPCTGPVLLFLATLVPTLGPARGGLLLFMYGVGHSALILAAGTSAGIATALVESRRLNLATAILRKVAGGLIILAGFYLLAQ